MKLENKRAIITGAAKGMGSAITMALAREGADVVLTARGAGALEALAEEVRELGRRAEVVPADVSDDAQVEAMVERAKRFFDGRIDILVNVAGITGPIETPIWEIEAEDFSEVIQTNIKGTFLPMKYVLPTMVEQRSGKVVNIGGSSGLRGYKYRAAYSSSKWGVRGLTRTAALDAGEYGVSVNVVCPGIVDTPRLERLCDEKARVRGWSYDEVYQEYLDEMALKRMTVPEDIANMVLFLASDDSRNITGQELTVDGGWDV